MRNFIKSNLKNERGLTLVELLAVIVILAIVGAIAFVMIGNIIENSRKDAHIANAMQLIDAAKLYEVNGESFEDGDSDTEAVTAKTLQGAGLLGEFIDPWTKESYPGTVGTVTKVDTKYKVTLGLEKCPIEDKSKSELVKKGRKICD